MDLNYTAPFFSESAVQSVYPYNQDLVISLLLIIAACLLFMVIDIIVSRYMRLKK